MDEDAVRLVKLDFERGPADAGVAALAVTRHGGHDAGAKVDQANPAIVEIVQIEPLARRIKADAINAAELRGLRRAAVTAEAFFRSRHDADPFPAGVDLANTMIQR